MVKRNLHDLAVRLFAQFPVVTITGPRQSGKTTLSQMAFPELSYRSLEAPDTRQFAREDPRLFLRQLAPGGVIDEIQRVPELVSYIQTVVDSDQRNGQFILTGSSQFELGESVSQSLAGRTALLKLLPYSLDELPVEDPSSDNILCTGFYPRIYNQNLEPGYFLNGYLETYVQRDVRRLLQIRNLHQFERFLSLCAGRTGQILNTNSLSNAVGVDHKTIRQWIGVLEASYLIFLLPPYHANFNKRIIKAPKLYFTDVGLCSHLLGIRTVEQLTHHPLRGALFETLIVTEILKQRFHRGYRSNLYFFRDHLGNEVDLLLEEGNNIYAFEIKSAVTFNAQFLKGLKYWQKLTGAEPEHCYVVMGDTQPHQRGEAKIIAWRDVSQVVGNIA